MQMRTAALSSTRVLQCIHPSADDQRMYSRETPGGIWRTTVATRAHIYILFIPRHTHYDTMLEKGVLDSPRSNVAYLGLYSDLISFSLRCVFVFNVVDQWLALAEGSMFAPMVILSPSDSAIPCVLLRIRTCPVMVPDSRRSILRFASASSPRRTCQSVA